MDDAYQTAMRTLADAYESEIAAFGGKSLARVATIVVNSGSFFQRLRAGKTFSVGNLDRLAAWFRDPTNWPNASIPHPAVLALTSIGRPPVGENFPQVCGKGASDVASNLRAGFDQAARA